jgi:hypothetical protein
MNVLAGSRASKRHWLSAPLMRRMGRFLLTEPRWHARRFVELMRRGGEALGRGRDR